MITALHHIGISVVNLERSIAFYRDFLGMELSSEHPFGGPRFERILRLTGASGRAAHLHGGGTEVELFEFAHPSPRRSDPDRPACDNGITHFCIEVADLRGLYARMSEAGVDFHCPPIDFDICEATYCRDPDGNIIEMIEMYRTPGAQSANEGHHL